MKRFFAIFFLILGVSAKSQYHEIGFMVGTSYYIGDINPQFHIPVEPNLGGGLIYRYNFNDRVAFKGSILYNRIYAHDEDSKDTWQENRNLHFRNDIFEFSGQVEINFLSYEVGDRRRPSSPYLFVGLALFRHNPEAEFDGRWIDLQPLGTEGQGIEGFDDRYPLTQISIPFGVGFKFNITGSFAGSVEWGMRRTFTDYLDDVSTVYVDQGILIEENGPLTAELSDRSFVATGPDGTNTGMQRGETNREDWYVFTGLILTYKLGQPRVKCPTAFD
ncbi:MAG: DUF6089 family protein [Bacteroidota bacterium]